MKTWIILSFVVLTACGGGGSETTVETHSVDKVTVTVSQTEGSQSPSEAEQVPTPREDSDEGSEQATEGCKTPQASAQGITHGKPPVWRCK